MNERVAESPRVAPLERGDPAPWFIARALSGRPDYVFDTVAGRHVLLLFYASAASQETSHALALVSANRHVFDDLNAAFFGVTCDPADAQQGRIAQQIPGIRHFLDYDRRVSSLYGAADERGYVQQWLLLDPALRVLGVFPISEGAQAIGALRRELETRPENSWAPVLEVPNVLSPEVCTALIAGYESSGGEESGFMRDVDGKTKLLIDPAHKQRRDWIIEDAALIRDVRAQIGRHLTIPVQRAFQFRQLESSDSWSPVTKQAPAISGHIATIRRTAPLTANLR